MSAGLDRWLQQATRCLSNDSRARVVTEIREHYESAREAAISGGATAAEADERTVAALGDARTANQQYRKVLLTAAEARLLREGNWEARAICSRTLVASVARSIPVVAILAGVGLLLAGRIEVGRDILLAGVAMAILFIAPFLPVYTPARSRALRFLKWAVLAGLPLLILWGDALKYSWLLIACLWPVAWVEWTRVSIRRKLPLGQWPRHLYF